MRRVLPASPMLFRTTLLLPLLLPLLAAGCVGGAVPPPGPPPPSAQIRVGFGGIVDTIAIDAIERLPLRAAELVAPDGTATPASTIEVDSSPRLATGQWALSHTWHEPLTGRIGLAPLAWQNAQAGAALRSQTQLLAMVSSAEIPLQDPVVYRRDWPRYRIRLTFGTPPGEVEMREFPAPAPPPQ
jgi:hypothetical protein